MNLIVWNCKDSPLYGLYFKKLGNEIIVRVKDKALNRQRLLTIIQKNKIKPRVTTTKRG